MQMISEFSLMIFLCLSVSSRQRNFYWLIMDLMDWLIMELARSSSVCRLP